MKNQGSGVRPACSTSRRPTGRGLGSEDKKIGILNFSASQLLNFSLLLFAVHCLLSTAVSAATVDEAIGRIQAKYNEVKDIQGSFSQTSYLKDLDRREKYEGKFFIKKPFGMRWAYLKPRDEEVIIRDTDAWIYKKSEKQALKSSFSKDAYSQVPIALINGLGNIRGDFDTTMAHDGALKLKPKKQMGFISEIILETAAGDFPIKTFSIFDINGNKTDITLKNIRINTGLEDSFFIFKAPPGVEVFDINP